MSNQLMDLQKQLENQLVIVKEMQVMKDDMTKIHTEIKQDVQELRDTITLTDSERSNLQSAVQSKANELTKRFFKKDVSDDLFLLKSGHFRSVIYKRIKDTFNITSYYKVRRIDFKHAMQVIEMVQLSNLKGYQLRLTPRQKEIALLNGDDIKEFEQEVINMAIDIQKIIETISKEPDLENIKYANKDVICKVFSMKKSTLDDWVRECKDNFPIENTVINPGGLCLINIDKWEQFLIWKSENKFK